MSTNKQASTGSSAKLRKAMLECEKKKEKKCKCDRHCDKTALKVTCGKVTSTYGACSKKEGCQKKGCNGKSFEAHHIVPHGAHTPTRYDAFRDTLKLLQEQLKNEDFDYDSCENGVCLPFEEHRKSGQGLHSKAEYENYINSLYEKVQGKSGRKFINTLTRFKNTLTGGLYA